MLVERDAPARAGVPAIMVERRDAEVLRDARWKVTASPTSSARSATRNWCRANG